MKTKARLFGALLLLSTATAFGLETGGGAQGQIATSPASSATAVKTDPFRERLAANGIDPDSETGIVLTRWLRRFASDPALAAGFKRWMASGDAFAETSLSPSDRLRVLALLKAMVSGGAGDCGFIANPKDFVAFAKTAPPHTVELTLELIDTIALSANAGYRQQPYATADLVDADAQLNATPALAVSADGSPQAQCQLLGSVVDAVIALPEPVQERASFELFRLASRKKLAFQAVLDDPSAYLDDVFDERRLPDVIRTALPADGSRPLPFSRVTVEAQWVNKTTPGDSAPFKDVFVNRHNNGVVAEVANAAGWSNFTLTYGIAPLRNQTVARGLQLTELSTVEDASGVAIANGDWAPGTVIDIPVPQPSHDGIKARHCVIGKTVRAATIFHTLKGAAVLMTCDQVKASGKKVTTHGAWLSAYGIGWTQSIDDDDGRTEAVIRNVTIEHAPL